MTFYCLLYFLRQGLSMNLEFIDSSRLAGWWQPATASLHWGYRYISLCLDFHVGTEDLKPDTYFLSKNPTIWDIALPSPLFGE